MKVLYILSAMFPIGRAYAARAMNICRMLRDSGCTVDVIADYSCDLGDIQSDGSVLFEGINIFYSTSHSAKDRTFFDKISVPYRASITLKKYLKNNHPDCTIVSSAFDRFKFFFKILKRKNIPIILESCEWFDKYNWKYGHFDPRYHQFKCFWDKYSTKVDGVIAISLKLENRYIQFVKNVIRIPGLINPAEINYQQQIKHDKIRIAFIGEIVCGKDLIGDLILALSLPEYIDKIEFHIYGPTKEEIFEQVGCGNITNNIIIHGFISQNILSSELAKCDYGSIIRPDRRSSHAGFPTKFVEYLTAGMPVIANLTGDIGLYLKNGYNGFILEGQDEASIKKVLDEICRITPDEYAVLRKNSIKTGNDNFNYNIFCNQLMELINNCIMMNNSNKG